MNIDLELDGVEDLQAEFDQLEEQGTTDRVYKVGTNTEYGIILEMGRGPVTPDSADALRFEVGGETVFAKEVSGHPPYPWFRPAIREFKANPESFVLRNTDYPSIDAIPSAGELLRAIAAALTNQMEKNVSATTATDRSPGTHPDHPEEQSGNLKADIGFERLR